jgi:hypothetical protein
MSEGRRQALKPCARRPMGGDLTVPSQPHARTADRRASARRGSDRALRKEDRQHCLEAGTDDFIVKPIGAEELGGHRPHRDASAIRSAPRSILSDPRTALDTRLVHSATAAQ